MAFRWMHYDCIFSMGQQTSYTFCECVEVTLKVMYVQLFLCVQTVRICLYSWFMVWSSNYSGIVSRISPTDSNFSWNLLTLDGDNIITGKAKCWKLSITYKVRVKRMENIILFSSPVPVFSSPVDVPQIKYGYLVDTAAWDWLDVSSPIFRCSAEVCTVVIFRTWILYHLSVKF